MPGRALQRQTGQFEATLMGQVDNLMQAEQRTQTNRTTLKTQQLLRNIDQQLMSEISEQFSRYDADEPVTQDLLDQETRTTRMRQLYDEGMQQIRQGVSMPGAQLQLETNAEEMWQQYQHSWEDKAETVRRAWNRGALPKDLGGVVDTTSLDDPEAGESLIDMMLRDAVANQTIDPHELGGLTQEWNTILYDTLARRDINDPRDEEGLPIESFNDAFDHSATIIEGFKQSGKITETHRDELVQHAAAVRDQRQEQLYREVENEMVHLTRNKGTQLYSHNPLNIRLDYLVESQDLFRAFGDELSTLTEKQRQDYATRLYTEIGRINRSLDEATSGSRVDAITSNYINPVKELAERDPRAAMELMDPNNPDSLIEQLRLHTGERRYGDISSVIEERVIRAYDSLREEFNTQIQAPFNGNPVTTDAFNSLMADYNIDHDSETSAHLRQIFLRAAGHTDGTADKVTVDQIRDFRKYLDDQATVGELSRQSNIPFTNFTNPLSRSAVQKMAESGVQVPEVFASLHEIGASDSDLDYAGEMIGELAKNIRGFFSSGRDSAFTLDQLNEVVSNTLGGLDRSSLEDGTPVANLYDALVASTATLVEASDMAGKILMGTVDGATHYEVDNIELQEGTLNPVFTVSYVNDAGNHISRRYSTEATSGEMGKLIRWGMVRDRSTNQIVMRNGQPVWRIEAEYDMDDIKRIHDEVRGTGTDTSGRTPPPTDYNDPAQAMGLTY